MIFRKFIFIFVISFSPTILAAEAIKNEIFLKCHAPEEPIILIGETISEEELIAIQGIVKKYMAQGEQYLSCIAQVEKDLGEDATDENKYLIVSLHNKLVNQMESVASLFNSAVRTYKEKQKDREIVNIDKAAIENRQKKESSKKVKEDFSSIDKNSDLANLSRKRREMRIDKARMKKEMNDISENKLMGTSKKSLEERLIMLNQLYEKKSITKDEYIAERKRILDEI
jgi:hypothetical protein